MFGSFCRKSFQLDRRQLEDDIISWAFLPWCYVLMAHRFNKLDILGTVLSKCKRPGVLPGMC